MECVCDSDYEIFTEEPYQIRKKSNGLIIKESVEHQGYIRCKLNRVQFYKHQILARQFLPNPLNLPFVDHKNRIRTDNRLINLRWIDRAGNTRNKVSCGEYKYNYVNEISDNSLMIEEYGCHQLSNYFYDYDEDKFYHFDEDQYKELRVCQHPTGKLINMIDNEGKKFTLRIKKFKKLNNID